MKKVRKYLMAVCILAVAMLCGISAGAKEGAAPVCAKKVTMYFQNGTIGSSLVASNPEIILKNLDDNAKITNLKSSNKKIQASEVGDGIRLELEVKKSGNTYKAPKLKNGEKATISFKVKQNGKTYKLSCKVTFKKQSNPVKSIKIGSKTFKSMKYSQGKWNINTKMKLPSSVKVKVTMNKGNTINYLQAEYYKPGWRKAETKRFKNGAKVPAKFRGGTLQLISVTYYNKSDLQGMVSAEEFKARNMGYSGNYISYWLSFK